MSQIEGNLIGLGVELWAEGNELRIVDVFKGSPAAQAGLLPGHYILEVDGQTIVSIGAKRAADMLRGPENSSVKLVISSGGDQSVAIDVVRRRVEIPSVSSAEMRNGQIGYIRITNFQKTTVNEVSRALFDLSSQGMKSLVIDLRRNPGGLLESAVELADYFIVRGGIVSTRGRNTSENRNYTAHAAGTWDMPLVVLIDAESASASEIFAGAIRDHDRGYIVGQISYGKGSVQSIIPVEGGRAAIRFTTAYYFPPSGQRIHRKPKDTDSDPWGVLPSDGAEVLLSEEQNTQAIERMRRRSDPLRNGALANHPLSKVEDPDDQKIAQDPQLVRAIEILRAMTSENSAPKDL
jgi:carboxyl-terminal processing protease